MLTLDQLLDIGGYELDVSERIKDEIVFDFQRLTEVLRAVYEQGATDGFESGLLEGRGSTAEEAVEIAYNVCSKMDSTKENVLVALQDRFGVYE